MELFYFVLLCLLGVQAAKMTENGDLGSADKTAILAIQIVDPSEKADGKNLKRTIESSLGYGYQNGVHASPKYQVYKYSQHDIPPYKGPLTQSSGKSAAISNYYQPGTTLFSTINQHGVVGDFSRNIPQPVNYQGSASVPVIILRVLPTQLTSNHLYPSLPQSNDFAPAINSLDIKSLLTSYLSKIKTPSLYSHPKYQPEVVQQQTYNQPQEQHYNQPAQTYQQEAQYDNQRHYNNYQVHNQQGETEIYQSQSYGPEVTKTSFDIVRSIEKQPEIYTDQSQYQGQQYLPVKLNSHQYLPQTQMSQSLLTYENYPSNTHTRVIFKTPEGHIRTSQQDTGSNYQDQEAIHQGSNYQGQEAIHQGSNYQGQEAIHQGSNYQGQEAIHQGSNYQGQEAIEQGQLSEPSQNLDYAQYGDQGVDYGDSTGETNYGEEQQQGGEANYAEEQQQGGDSNQFSYIQPQYYSKQDYSQDASQKTVYVYPKSYENASTKPASKKRFVKTMEPPQYGAKLKKQKSSS